MLTWYAQEQPTSCVAACVRMVGIYNAPTRFSAHPGPTMLALTPLALPPYTAGHMEQRVDEERYPCKLWPLPRLALQMCCTYLTCPIRALARARFVYR